MKRKKRQKSEGSSEKIEKKCGEERAMRLSPRKQNRPEKAKDWGVAGSTLLSGKLYIPETSVGGERNQERAEQIFKGEP